MNKTVLTLSLSLCCAVAAQAQNPVPNQKMPTEARSVGSRWGIGPSIGLGHSWLSQTRGTQVLKLSPSLGASLQYSRHPNWAFGADLFVSQDGIREEYKMDVNHAAHINLNAYYVRLPLKAIYRFGKPGQTIRPYVYLGPSIGYNFLESNSVHEHLPDGKKQNLNFPDYGPVDYKNYFNSVDLGIQGGAGVQLRLGKRTYLDLSTSYYHSLTNAGRSIPAQNQNFRIQASFIFEL